MKKVNVIEEISPAEGLTEAEIKAGIWNSPPATKGQGRYLILGKTIDSADFAALKSKEMVSYWSEDFLEECDMFTSSPGWRIHADGLSLLRSKGYQIEIDTIEAREKAKTERLAQRKIDDERKAIAKATAAETYAKAIEEFEAWLGSPKWDGGCGGTNGRGISLKRISHAGAEEYTEYFLNQNGKMEVFWYYNSDFWNSGYSDIAAPAHVIEGAAKIKAQQEAEEKKKKDAWEEEKKHRIYVHFTCPRCGRNVYINKTETERKKTVRCGKCHTGKKATEATTVEYQRKEDVEYQHIPAGAEVI